MAHTRRVMGLFSRASAAAKEIGRRSAWVPGAAVTDHPRSVRRELPMRRENPRCAQQLLDARRRRSARPIPDCRARRIVRRIEFPDTPTHGSQLHLVAIEPSSMWDISSSRAIRSHQSARCHRLSLHFEARLLDLAERSQSHAQQQKPAFRSKHAHQLIQAHGSMLLAHLLKQSPLLGVRLLAARQQHRHQQRRHQQRRLPSDLQSATLCY